MDEINQPISSSEKKIENLASASIKSSKLGKILLSESFIEKASLLILTALISGLLIPYIGNNLQSKKAKNDIVFQNQSKLLDDIAKTLLTYETLALDVSWYKSNQSIEDSAAHQKAYERYIAKIVDVFIEFRIEITKSRNLVSPEASIRLDSFFIKIKTGQDISITKLYKNKEASIQQWSKMHEVSHKMLDEANELISSFAILLGITKSSIK